MISTIEPKESKIVINRIDFMMQGSTRECKEISIDGQSNKSKISNKRPKGNIIRKSLYKTNEILMGTYLF